jgi:hypothetical protein
MLYPEISNTCEPVRTVFAPKCDRCAVSGIMPELFAVFAAPGLDVVPPIVDLQKLF